MATQYKAVAPVGRFAKGDFVAGLNERQIEKLLADGVIVAIEDEAVTDKSQVKK